MWHAISVVAQLHRIACIFAEINIIDSILDKLEDRICIRI